MNPFPDHNPAALCPQKSRAAYASAVRKLLAWNQRRGFPKLIPEILASYRKAWKRRSPHE